MMSNINGLLQIGNPRLTGFFGIGLQDVRLGRRNNFEAVFPFSIYNWLHVAQSEERLK
jgi:hypothetical protein